MFQYAVYGNASWDGTNFTMKDVKYAKKKLPKILDTWSGDLSAFKKRGGKLVHLHGTQDIVRRAVLQGAYSLALLNVTFSDPPPRHFHAPVQADCRRYWHVRH